MTDTINSVTAAADAAAAPPKYDDPYEENPILSKCLCNGIEQKCAESEKVVTVERTRDQSSDLSVEREMSSCSLAAGTSEPSGEQKHEVVCSSVMPVRSFELSAEYGGFFVVPEPSNNKTTAAEANSTQHQQAVAGQLVGQHADSSMGLYDEPWDLSTVKHSITERLHRSSQKDVVGRLDSNCRPPPPSTDVYAQPNKRDKQRQRYRIAIEPSTGDGPSYGVLCERMSDDSEFDAPPPPLVQRQAGTRSNSQRGTTWTTGTDSRPPDDYDVPWDQKKKFSGQTGKREAAD